MNTLAPYIRRAPLISTLPVELQTDLERAGEERSYRRRQIVFMADQLNDYVYLLSSGRVKLVRVSPTGREITLYIVNPMEFFGEAHLFDDNVSYDMTAEVLEDADVVVFRRTEIVEALTRSPESMRELTILQANRRAQAENRLTEYVFYDVPTRVARLLTRLSSTHGRYSKGGSLIRLKLTHQEIANLIGSTRETTTLILNDFRRRGLIELQGRRIVVSDSAGLRDLAH
ncbi:MAG: Crp/Fnr family transcriptional regulator [Capsulimonadaceae bacterium]|nr:Crp/Fnr family transcriptional regulator [Capsulimonadaceae bacterium]